MNCTCDVCMYILLTKRQLLFLEVNASPCHPIRAPIIECINIEKKMLGQFYYIVICIILHLYLQSI